MRNLKKFPVVLDWAVGNETCNDAKRTPETFACKANNSICYDSDNGPGHRCNFSDGYKGNPYLADECKVEAAKIFAEKELRKATNTFSKSLVIGKGGYGVVYKGVLSDNRVVAIKRSKAIDGTQIEQFVNEIIHRDVESANTHLDEEFTAKVSDFGVSRLVSFDQEQVSTLVQGTLGYMDPEYFHSGILTEKSDIYSFGVVLIELLTGKKAICSECKEKSLALCFISSLKEDCLFENLEDRMEGEGNAEQIERVAELARSCLRIETKQILKELEILRQFGKQMHLKLGNNSEEYFMWYVLFLLE
ncbi:conserved hypothetical protein [Ricinus communis]|uniref:Protein kinase domain-containing protein n=1 Tax=Ricinus communis TaxID=3988 RepID=B9S2Q6_RICCO|nr:conserved hypothetical protein [Ricinus communis]